MIVARVCDCVPVRTTLQTRSAFALAAHLALAHTGPRRAVVDLVRAGGRFHTMIHDAACRHAALPAAELSAEIRAMAGSRRRAPGISYLEPLP